MSLPKFPPREGSRDIDEGIVVSRFPDWCKTPNAPVPYTIYAKQQDDANTAPTVRLTKKRGHTRDSLITQCHGDEPGVGLGVKSGTRGSICQPKTWSETVRYEGKNAVRHDDEWWMNNKNTTGKLAYVKDTTIYDPTPHYSEDDPEPKQSFWLDKEPEQEQKPEQSVMVADASGAIGLGSATGGAGAIPQPQSGSIGSTIKKGVESAARYAIRRNPIVMALTLDTLLEGNRLESLAKLKAYHLLKSLKNPATGEVLVGHGGRSPIFADQSMIDGYFTSDSTGLQDLANGALSELYGQPTSMASLTDQEFEQLVNGWRPVNGTLVAPEEFENVKAAAITAANVRVEAQAKPKEELEKACDEICMYACQCKQDRGSHTTFTACLGEKMRDKHYDPDSGTHPQGGPKRPKPNGPRPEVNYTKDSDGTYQPVQSRSQPQYPSNRPVMRGAPRPDISWWKNDKLWKIFELKFGGDKPTKMQGERFYQKIAQDQGLTDEDLIQIDIDEDCACSQNGNGKTIGRVKPGVDKCK